MKPLDCLLEAVAANEPHRIERASVRILAQPVDGHDPGVLESASNLRFQHEPVAVGLAGGITLLDFLEGDFPAEFLIQSDRNLSQATLSVRAEHSKSCPGRTGLPEREFGGRLDIGRDTAIGGNQPDGRLYFVIGDSGGERIQLRVQRHKSPQALLGVVVMLLQMLLEQRREQFAACRREVAFIDQQGFERPRLVQHPGIHRRDQLIAVDEIKLQGEDSQQQISIGNHRPGISSRSPNRLRRPEFSSFGTSSSEVLGPLFNPVQVYRPP